MVIIGAGIFDMVDGRVARQTDQVTVFGAFFDSVIDRYSDRRPLLRTARLLRPAATASSTSSWSPSSW